MNPDANSNIGEEKEVIIKKEEDDAEEQFHTKAEEGAQVLIKDEEEDAQLRFAQPPAPAPTPNPQRPTCHRRHLPPHINVWNRRGQRHAGVCTAPRRASPRQSSQTGNIRAHKWSQNRVS